ncbi:MAG: RNA-binding S4 domain-containing protein [Pseudanabaenaceae cyanobacterium bins.39]|nr:RNA-binding S4 domain-containing protein [Pseudanabaenaceae cyanobacterium bins.39]
MQETFELTGEYITLCNLLKVCGVADTGGYAKLMIIDGLVRVDGSIELKKGCKIRSGQVVSGADFTIRVV